MKDLYKLFKINKLSANRDYIKSRIEAAPQEHREAGKYILLHSKRKEIYDRTYNNLGLIGQLRAELKLNNTEHWNPEQYADFIPAANDNSTGNDHLYKINRLLSRAFIIVLMIFSASLAYIILSQNLISPLFGKDLKMQVSISALNMREKPSLEGKIIGVLHKGQQVYARKNKKHNNWLYITTEDGKSGYASARYLRKANR